MKLLRWVGMPIRFILATPMTLVLIVLLPGDTSNGMLKSLWTNWVLGVEPK